MIFDGSEIGQVDVENGDCSILSRDIWKFVVTVSGLDSVVANVRLTNGWWSVSRRLSRRDSFWDGRVVSREIIVRGAVQCVLERGEDTDGRALANGGDGGEGDGAFEVL